MIKEANTRLHFLRVLKSLRMCLSDMIVIYSTFIRPVLEYCAVVWNSGLSISQINDIERVQKRACRIMLGSQYESYDNALSICNLPSLSDRRISLCEKFAKSLTKPDSRLHDLIPANRESCHGRYLRNRNEFTEFKCRTGVVF